MCEECEEGDVLREVYLARRTRMAQTWRPRGPMRWSVDATAPVSASDAAHAGDEPKLIAAE